MKMKYLLVLIVTIGVAVAQDESQDSPSPAVPAPIPQVAQQPFHHPHSHSPSGQKNSNAWSTNPLIRSVSGLFSGPGNTFAQVSSIQSSNSYNDNLKQFQTACGSAFREGTSGIENINNKMSPACMSALQNIISSDVVALPTGVVSSGNQRNTGKLNSAGQKLNSAGQPQRRRRNRRGGRNKKNGNTGSTAVAGTSDTGLIGVGASSSA